MPIVYSYDCNKGNRKYNDDAIVVCKNTKGNILSIICDGIGSHEESYYSSNYIVNNFKKEWLNTDFLDYETMKEWLFHKINDFNRLLLNKSRELDKKMGTTIVILATFEDEFVVYNVGDSRAYGITKEDAINLFTVDDSFVGALLQAGVLTETEAKNHPEKNVLTQAIAVKEDIIPHIYEDKINKYSYLFICSDGLSNMINVNEIIEIIKFNDLSVSIKTLIDICNERGGFDNISVAILKNLGGQYD